MILEAHEITKNFGGVRALNKCSLGIKKNKITALIGPNGSGKTTLFDVISRLIKPNSGFIKFKQERIDKFRPNKVAKMGISRTFQDPRLFKNLTIKDHFMMALSTNDESMFAKEKDVEWKIKEIMNLIGLTKPLHTLGSDLSYGQRKLLDLGVALAKPHDLLMLDEPVAGVNPKLRKQIKKIIQNLNKKGETVFLIEHDMNFVMDLVDHIFVLDAGEVIASGKPKQIQNNKKVLDAYLGE